MRKDARELCDLIAEPEAATWDTAIRRTLQSNCTQRIREERDEKIMTVKRTY